MSLGLLFPLGLAALAALLLPLLVHLVRREEQRPTDFAALRWLAARLKPRAKIRFEDLWLLALRLLLVAAMALLLARPVLYGGAGDAPWLLVVPGADPAAAPSLPDDAERRWLAPGFPALDTPRPETAASVSSLLRQLDAELPAATPVTVLVPAAIVADGARPRLSRAVDWRIAPLPTAAAPASPVQDAGFVFAVRHAPEQDIALRYLRAAAESWQVDDAPSAPDIADTGAALAEGITRLVWLAPGELPSPVREWIGKGGHILLDAQTAWPASDEGVVVWRDTDGHALARSTVLGHGRVTQLQKTLSPAELPALLEADFPQRLRDLLDGPPAPPRLADAATHAPLIGGASFPESPRGLDTPLLWLILALFALERWFATRKRAEATA